MSLTLYLVGTSLRRYLSTQGPSLYPLLSFCLSTLPSIVVVGRRDGVKQSNSDK